MVHWFHRFYMPKHEFWHRIRNQRDNLPRKTFFIRQFIVVFGYIGYNASKQWFGFFEKWPVSTVSTLFKPKIPKPDTGFEISVKIYPGIRTPYALLSLFLAGTAICENSVFQKSGGLAFLTTSHYTCSLHTTTEVALPIFFLVNIKKIKILLSILELTGMTIVWIPFSILLSYIDDKGQI